MRADARRNVEGIRRAALDVFRAGGLATPLDEVARAAGVSKGTIYHRFGSRCGLIDAVVDELVAARLGAIIDAVDELEGPLERFEQYLLRTWLLQFDEPAANDVLMRTLPDSEPLTRLFDRACHFGSRLLADAQAAGVVRADITPDDLAYLILERGVIVRACDQQPRDDYHRRLDFILRGLRTNPAQP
ncbi:TetR/AcrR family transcriptional regulator; helix-turn-helix transcriptional regulator [Actinoplanes bogorensis]|uniref:TetR/AcrR family transcriptional regulator helix-turn-helix transcriptional regulator n=1 Tax=Paractinoplanes bogorensis TaxID=1610840 RepID=A0ABS5YPB5_9ACTN|nr:TetR/AcrR family transcriptional regulator [Actinoplanes bogorensis]MBU2664564.1 TetR/AcrR family transcriptional regulator; helix-turn-helix transcriptional regulator [Actinoplanes bogorensis]